MAAICDIRNIICWGVIAGGLSHEAGLKEGANWGRNALGGCDWTTDWESEKEVAVVAEAICASEKG